MQWDGAAVDRLAANTAGVGAALVPMLKLFVVERLLGIGPEWA
jgi:hypothetical protein